MKTNMNQFKWMRGLGNASYIIGAAFIIAALLTSFVPPTTAVANQPNYPLNCPPATKTPEPTATSTNTPDPTDTPEPPTNTPTDTPEPPTDTPTNTPTDTSEPPTNTPTDTATNTATNTPTDTSTFTPTDTLTFTPTNTLTFTPTYHDPFEMTFTCTGFRVISFNDFESSFVWSINYGPSGTGVVAPFGFVDFETGYYPGLVTLYSDGKLMAAGYMRTDCGDDEKTPTPPVVKTRTPRSTKTPPYDPTKVYKTLIPKLSLTPDILIPVTGVDISGGNHLTRMLFSMGLLFLGMGLVLNGVSHRRKELDI